ncbi:MAG: DNA primase [Planctomycetes bacterium]|nr:DNA primase [Planctomycetota bacterium]
MNDDRERVRDANPIVDVIQEFFPLQSDGGGRFKALCPFHREKSPSFKVDPDRGTYHCFGCGERGDVFSFVMKMDHLEFRDALSQLARRANIELGRGSEVSAHVRARREADLELLERAATWFERQLGSKSGAPAREYLRARGFSDDTLTRFRVGYAPDAWHSLADAVGAGGPEASSRAVELGLLRVREGRVYDAFRGRVMFPIRSVRGQVLGFGGRILQADVPADGDGGPPPKYINSPESPLFRKGELLYGHFEGRDAIRRGRRLVIMEGYTDVMMAKQAGLDQAVATLGTALAEPNVDTIARHADRVVLVFDGDDAGRRAALKALRLLLPRPLEVRVVPLPGGDDPCDLLRHGVEAFDQRLEAALEAMEFVFSELATSAGIDTDSSGPAKERVARECFEFIELSTSEIRRDEALDALGRRLGIASRALRREFERRRAPRRAEERAARLPARADATAEAEEEAILMACLRGPSDGPAAGESYGRALLRLHPAEFFRDPVRRSVAARLSAEDRRLQPIDFERVEEKALVLELFEHLESREFEEETACRLLQDLLIRRLEAYRRLLGRLRGGRVMRFGVGGSEGFGDEIRRNAVLPEGDRFDRETSDVRQGYADIREMDDREVDAERKYYDFLIGVRVEIDRLKSMKRGEWRTLVETAERWLLDRGFREASLLEPGSVGAESNDLGSADLAVVSAPGSLPGGGRETR